MPTPLEMLWIAVGFTGALTLRWVFGLTMSLIRKPIDVTGHLGAIGSASDQIAQAISTAKREVFVLARELRHRPIAQALIDARLRGVNVEIVLDEREQGDSASELHFLVEQGLPPMIEERQPIRGNVILVDSEQLFLGGYALSHPTNPEESEDLLIVRGNAAVAKIYREHVLVRKSQSRALPPKTSLPPAAVAKSSPTPTPEIKPPAQPIVSPSPTPTVPIPTPTPVAKPTPTMPTMTPKPIKPMPTVNVPITTNEPEPSEPEPMPIHVPIKSMTVPVVTQASSDLMARLRQELASASTDEMDEEEREDAETKRQAS